MNRFTLMLGLYVGAVVLAAAGAGYALARDSRAVTVLALVLITLGASALLLGHLRRSNRRLAAFLHGIELGDLAQRPRFPDNGRFAEVETALAATLERLRALRREHIDQAQYLQRLIEDLPVAFVLIGEDGSVTLPNKATRRLLGTGHVGALADLENRGTGFARDLREIRPGERRLCELETDTGTQQLILGASEIGTADKRTRIISMQNVQQELDTRELQTWQQVLEVTSHEILNSLAPIASCAETAESLVKELAVRAGDDDLDAAAEAVNTIARRSRGLMGFVSGYRQLTRLPAPQSRLLELAGVFSRLDQLLGPELAQREITFTTEVKPSSLKLEADEELLDQALINLVRNAMHALAGRPDARLSLAAYRDPRQQIVIDITDNGAGVPAALRKRIFLPFFSTRAGGSGIGLALVRHSILSQGGHVRCRTGPDGGCRFSLIFP